MALNGSTGRPARAVDRAVVIDAERLSMIEYSEVRKSYGEVEALQGISTSIGRSEIVGLLGPNGAGKTTAMKILVGYLLPTSGTVRVAGQDVVDHPMEAQKLIGYLPENAPTYSDMLVQDHLQFMAQMRELDGAQARKRIAVAIEECDIREVLTRPIGQLSKGYRQRVGLAAAILHDPEIVILDEPTNGLDPNQIVEVRRLIRRMGETKTVILSTHILSEVEASCDRAVILIDGQIRADGKLKELTRSRVQVVQVAPDDPENARRLFEGLEGVRSVTRDGNGSGFQTYRLQLDHERDIGEQISEAVRGCGWPMRELRRDDQTLEQIFRELTSGTASEVAR
jgi:ABC-2 type transport system ATP-binding protein